MTARHTLICPGLFGPLPLLPHPRPTIPTLDRLIGRAIRIDAAPPRTTTAPLAAVLAQCGICATAERELPTAALCLLGENGTDVVDSTAYWLHAAPVYLRADRERLLCFAGDAIAPDRAEAAALVTLFNAHFAGDGLHLVAPTPQRWYLRVAQQLEVQSVPLAQIQGTALDTTLLGGADAQHWNSVLTEVQMLFFNSAVNHARERQRRPPISGIWTWGGGTLPQLLPDADPPRLIGDHPLLRGLARHLGYEYLTLAQWRAAVPHDHCLIYWDALATALLAQDVAAWAAALVELDASLVATADQVRRGSVPLLVIDSGHAQHLHISPRQLRRFWHRRGFFEALSIDQRRSF